MSKPIGFYKDKKGRTRPITKRKPHSKFHGQVHEPSWKESSLQSIKSEVTIKVPKGTKVNIEEKAHNPTEIEMTSLRDPYYGSPLEPTKEYGSSIMYNPYTQTYVMVSTPEGKVVKPRYTEVDEKSLEIASTHLKSAADEVRTKQDIAALERANRHLDDAQRVEPWHSYPTAGLQKDPVYRELKESSTYVGNMLDSARDSEGAERQHWLNKARERILASERAIVATEN